MPGSPSRPLQLRDALLSEWSDFCSRFGAASSAAAASDWLGGASVDVPAGTVLRVTLDRFPALDQAAKNRRPAVWCLYSVKTVPVRRKRDGQLVAEARVPVPLSVGAARHKSVTQFPPKGLPVDAPLRLWVRAWNDDLPESHKWGTAVSTAAWIVTVSQQLRVPEAFDAA